MEQPDKKLWWGCKEENKKHIFLKAWDSICLPKSNGGMRFGKTCHFNKDCVAKLGWQLTAEPPKNHGLS